MVWDRGFYKRHSTTLLQPLSPPLLLLCPLRPNPGRSVRSKTPWYNNYFNNPPGRLLVILVTLTVGWPSYLAFNISGQEYDRFTCHYDLNGPIFSNRERLQVHISDLGIMSAIYVLYKIVMAKGHPSLPHYGESEWDWLRGALVTVDRDYGVLNKVFHNSTNTHVVHHLFSTINAA
ncbi:hypothetical protein GBA52_021843 [Prunus armeniaca]|nr:hypothetical protein GBA52_021843 [Prunus armeniaca]